MLNKTLWIFGDSFSTQFDNKTQGIWGKEYIEWKGYVPKTFGDIIGDELGLEIKHLAVGGCDNDTIFETILKHAPLIKNGDIIIIGWTAVNRFRLASINDKFKTVIPLFSMNIEKEYEYISKTTLEEIIVNRESEVYIEELYHKVEFINWLFKCIPIFIKIY